MGKRKVDKSGEVPDFFCYAWLDEGKVWEPGIYQQLFSVKLAATAK